MGAKHSNNKIISFSSVITKIDLGKNFGIVIDVEQLPEPFESLELLCDNVGYSHIKFLLESGKEFTFNCKVSNENKKVLILDQLVGCEVFTLTSKISGFNDLSMRYTCNTNKYSIIFKKAHKHTIITSPEIKENLNYDDTYRIRYIKHRVDHLYVLLDYCVVDGSSSGSSDNNNYEYTKL